MATPRFNGRFRLTILYQNKVLMEFASSNVNQNIDFDANLVSDGFANGNARSTIFIYNLSPDKKNTLESLITQSKTSTMQFKIEVIFEYAIDNYQLLSYGDITGVYNELGEQDFKTNLIVKSGEGAIANTVSAASYPPGTKLSSIISTECQKLVDGQSVKSVILTNISDYTFPSGFAYSGQVFNSIGKVCYENNNLMFIHNGNVIVAGASWSGDNSASQRDLNFYNGLLEPPHVGQVNFTKKFQAGQSSVSFQFKSLILPNVQINSVVSVLGSLYTVKRITHYIQSRLGVAYSIVEGFANGSV